MSDDNKLVPFEGSVELLPADQITPMELKHFDDFAAENSATNIVGKLLRFSKGDWLVGKDGEEMEENTELVADMAELYIGWIKWVDNKPERVIMGRVFDGYKRPERNTLGDLDKEEWELNDRGEPSDPWRQTAQFILRTPKLTAPPEDEDLFTFVTTSHGGLNAVGNLSKAFAKGARMRMGQIPVVRLGVGKYKHSNAQFGIIKFPTFDVVGWENRTIAVPAPAPAPAPVEAPKAAKGRGGKAA